MKPMAYTLSTAVVVLGLALSTPVAFAQSRGHGGGGGGGARTSGGGHSTGGTAVSRGSGGGGGGHTSSSGGSGGQVTASGGARSTAGSDGGSVAVGGARPRDGRVATGQAVPRTGRYFYNGRFYSYHPYYFYGYGAFGLGALYYDPFWWGYPYGGWGYPWGYYGGYYGGDYGYAYDPQDAYGVKGGLKLKVTPKDAEVYVDGYYVGIVDDYDGAFQRLNLVAGTHHIEFKAKGYEPLSVDVKIEPRDTITYHGELQLSAGPK